MSDDEDTWVDVAFVPNQRARSAYYLQNSDSTEVYELAVIGVLIKHRFSPGTATPMESETKLAYLEGVEVVECPEYPTLVGVFDQGEEPTAGAIEVARIGWELYLRESQLRGHLSAQLRELTATYQQKLRSEPLAAGRVELGNEQRAAIKKLKQEHCELSYAARVEAAQKEQAVA